MKHTLFKISLPGNLKYMYWLLLLMLIYPVSQAVAHIGSPGVVYEGKAGPYQVLVSILPPDVIPGTAQVSIFVEGKEVTAVTAQPVYWYAGDKGAPAPDEMIPEKEEPGKYEGIVWLMETGTASVKIRVEGPAGIGEAIVPVMAVATAKRDMDPSLGWILAGLGLLLFVLMVTIIGASVSDGTLKPGEELSQRMRRKRLVTMGTTAIICGLVLYGGSTWWNNWAKEYEKYMYRPYKASASVQTTSSGRVMTLQVDSSSLEKRWLSYLVPDHGKLMHLFLVKERGQDVFAHLHPTRKDTLTFEVNLPPLPAGKYLVYADVVRWHGFASTIATTVDIPPAATPVKFTSLTTDKPASDPDNTYIVTNPIDNQQILLADSNSVLCGKPGVNSALPDGSTIRWEQQPNVALTVGKVYSLTFTVHTPDGQPAVLEPYLGMKGHAVVLRGDGSVFIHLHPVGTYSMASQWALQERIAADDQLPVWPSPTAFRDSIDQVVARMEQMTEAERNAWLMPGMVHTSEHAKHEGSVVSFPYAFPQPGNYRIWVQIKLNGKIQTAAFDAQVKG